MLNILRLNQNKNIVAIFLMAILLVFMFLPSPSFAVTEPVLLDSSWTKCTSDSSSNNSWLRVASGSEPVYCVLYWQNSSLGYCCASSSAFTVNVSFNGSSSAVTSTGTIVYLSPLYEFHNTFGSNYTPASSIPVYNTLAAAQSAISDYINNPPTPPSAGYSLDYSLPAGNVIYIDITNHSEEIFLTQTTPLSYWSYTSTQYSGVVSSLPSSSGFDLPIVGTSAISWSGSGKSDSFGKYSSWVSSQVVSGQTSNHGHAYFVVVNPLANNVASSNGTSVDSVANSYINISVPYANSYKVYPLKESFNAGVYDNENPEGTNNGNGEPDGEGGWTQTGDDGEAWTPEYGGLTTPESNESTIHDFLQRISQDISGFFGGAIGAVKTLVAAGSEFFNVLVGLYSWLPPAVLSVLSSALILVITIGVVKVFI